MDDSPPSGNPPLFVTDLEELYRLLGLPADPELNLLSQSTGLPLLVSKSYLSRIPKGDPEHPLLLQVMPRREELDSPACFRCDPFGENDSLSSTGTLRKYPGRLLIVATPDCAVHCRFCFRRHLRERFLAIDEAQWDRILAELEADPSLHEVILSGGDPLMLDDATLADLLARLDRARHVRRVRIHTRVPVVLPQRVTADLMKAIRPSRGNLNTLIVVVHVNHPAEIDEAVAAAFARFVDAGIPLLSQSVLLRRVNDRLEVLAELFERLVDLRVMPYYLHQLDRVAGTAHFEVPVDQGMELVRRLRAILPGYAVPRYVRETVGATSKSLLA